MSKKNFYIMRTHYIIKILNTVIMHQNIFYYTTLRTEKLTAHPAVLKMHLNSTYVSKKMFYS